MTRSDIYKYILENCKETSAYTVCIGHNVNVDTNLHISNNTKALVLIEFLLHMEETQEKEEK